MPNKYAVLVGCDYPNTAYELHGCVQDALGMRDLLIDRYGFQQNNINLLIDSGELRNMRPTGENIRNALIDMVGRAKSESDVLFFHYSGHSTRVPLPDTANDKECIVPSDFNLLTAEDFRFIMKDVHPGATFTLIFDTSVSGGLIDKDMEQTDSDQEIAQRSWRRTFMPLESLLGILRHRTNNSDMEAEDFKAFLYLEFGDAASYTVRRLLNHVDEVEQLHPEMGILLSGCRPDENCIDVCPYGDPRGYGAFTNAILTLLKKRRGRRWDSFTNKELVLRARDLLQGQEFTQHPCLYCSERNADRIFLEPR
eukprot:PITA_33642